MKRFGFLLLLGSFLSLGSGSQDVSTKYTPDWPSLDSRPLPTWYDQAKVGIFMHFGPYSVPGVQSEWFWMQVVRNESEGDHECAKYMEDYFPPGFTYQEFAPMLWMDFFNASQIADIVVDSGAQYMVFTSKHHDGFCNWPSTHSYSWNSMDVGPHRDVVGELKQAFDDKYPGFHFGLYYSLFEWFNPIYLSDKGNGFNTREYALNKMLPELKQIVETYEPHVLWSDGDWETSFEYFGSQDFLAWLYNESPTKDVIVTNDRWGIGTSMQHGDFYSGPDRFSPGILQSHKWEQCLSVDVESWGIRRNINIDDVLTMNDILRELASTVSCGGNILINVGPTKEGTIIPIFQERLRDLGQWLRANGEAIYGTTPWLFQNDTTNGNVWYTLKGNVVYSIILEWPDNDVLEVSSPVIAPIATTVTMLGLNSADPLPVSDQSGLVSVTLPSMSRVWRECGSVCQYAVVLKWTNLINGGAFEDPSVDLHF